MITFDEKKYSQITEKEIKDALQFSTEQVIRDLPEFTEQFQKAYSENGFYQPIPNNYWTCGFWTGEIWLAYEYSQDERLKKAGEVQVKSFLDRIDKKIEVDHHDMGFLYSPSCVAAYKLTGSKEGREAAIKAADQLIFQVLHVTLPVRRRQRSRGGTALEQPLILLPGRKARYPCSHHWDSPHLSLRVYLFFPAKQQATF